MFPDSLHFKVQATRKVTPRNEGASESDLHQDSSANSFVALADCEAQPATPYKISVNCVFVKPAEGRLSTTYALADTVLVKPVDGSVYVV
jgi:hypothetical protein